MANDEDSSIEMHDDYPDAAEVEDSSDDEGSDDEEEQEPPNVHIISPPRNNTPTTSGNTHARDEPMIMTEGPPPKKVKRTVSIAHEYVDSGNAVIVHVDVETGGEECGVVQIACVIYDLAEPRQFDRTTLPTFNKYIKPPTEAEWCPIACGIHGLTASHPEIKRADDLVTVWDQFRDFVNQYTTNKKGILCAWNGKSCDVKWLWKITEETHVDRCKMPDNIDYFLDPILPIKHYKSCPLNQSKSQLVGYGLGEVWCYVTGQTELPGAHNALNDTLAQAEVVHDEKFFPFLNKNVGIESMESILEPKRKARRERDAEMKRPLPPGWKSTCKGTTKVKGKNITSAELQQIACNGSAGGGVRGPKNSMWTLLSKFSLVELFLYFFELQFLEKIAKHTNKYGNEDWVKESQTGHYWEIDGATEQPRKKKLLIPCDKNDPNKRKRYGGKWIDVTPGFILVFFGIILVNGALCLRRISLLWGEKWQSGIGYIQNSCTILAFKQIRRHLHFVDNDKLPKKGDRRYSPLQKVLPVLEKLQQRLRSCYTLGDRISIDESMIKYCGKYISWIQYMPKKPIKHGIKVYALCCAYTGYLYSFEIYTGKEGTKDGSPRAVIGRLLDMAGITPLVGKVKKMTGTVLYTDNWYTSLEVMRYVYEWFGMLLVGTVSLTTKKSRTGADFAFHKYKNPVMRKLPRGWDRLAFQDITDSKGNGLYTVQATIWKDKKMVGFLHNHLVQNNQDHVVKRYDKKSRKKEDVKAQPVVSDYNQYMGGVDAKDRDTADWSVSLKSNTWYFRVFYFIFDSVTHAMWVLIKMKLNTMSEEDVKQSVWASFTSKDTGRFDFQLTLGILLIKKGLELDWKHGTPFTDLSGRPAYCRSKNLVPCQCPKKGVQCFFCSHGHTNGTDHRAKTVRRVQAKRNVKKVVHAGKKRVNFGKGSRYCQPCYYRLRDKFPRMTAKEIIKHKDCKQTDCGCPGCNDGAGCWVCKPCWKEYTHDDD